LQNQLATLQELVIVNSHFSVLCELYTDLIWFLEMIKLYVVWQCLAILSYLQLLTGNNIICARAELCLIVTLKIGQMSC
jgi:hypothetical protein